ncbi:family 16 glycosylhydrolase [Tabrizicola sp.]|uniref:family 16 glycosylhydrolase n=1 Tax=Tabrizicola sp. TaxID=2005166 RepID=UPI003F359D18
MIVMTPRALALCYAVAVYSGVGPVHAEEAAAKGTAFREDFDSFDRDFWYISDGWTNGDHQNCEWSERAIDVVDGILKLSFLPGGEGMSKKHFCGEIQSNAIYHHGTYEARIRTAKGSGLNAAFFTYIGPVHKQPHDEIDFEVLTRDTGSVSLNTFVDGKPQNGTTVPVDPPTDQDFHIFSFTWGPNDIRWFIDGKEVHRATSNLPVTPQKIFASHWGTDTLVDWMGPFTTPDAPVVMEVDWIAFTPLGEPCQFPESVVCQTP